ncbi:MAG: hypothetical protein H6685_00805 [Deltaproteobacteria bacterium]|nr:hypothetical protein [Deltaproteobacteria bacterium]
MRAKAVLILVAIALLMIVVRVLVGGVRENRVAGQYLAQGNIPEAMAAYDRSLHWYLPLSPTFSTAIDGMRSIAEDAEKSGDVETAVVAWRLLRSGMYANEWWILPHKSLVAEADERIARLVAKQGAGGDASREEQIYQKEFALLTKQVGPNKAWAFLAVVAFFGWVAAVLFFIAKAFGPKDEFHRRPAAIYGGVFLVAYAVWMVALSNA